MVTTFRIVLRQDEGYDAHQTRELDLELDSKFAIGRASKNVSKGHLLPAKNNVYIDSPVVSREHAILTANATSGTPQVYITDTKSMHGTQVNGVPLVPHTPKQLSNGDTLQFGVNVNRNESYFVAFKYTFSAEVTNYEPFSRGFTVPDEESEEEEELGFAHSGGGSQLDPLILDDSDAASEHENNEEETEQSEDIANVTLAQLADEEDVFEIDTSSLVEEDDAAAAAAADSDTDNSDDSDAANAGSVLRYSPESPLIQQAHYTEEVVQVESTPFDQTQPSALHATSDAALTAQRADGVSANIPNPVETFSLPAWQGINDHVTFPSSMFDSGIAPPLPPRPSQKRQKTNNEASLVESERMLGASPNVTSWSPMGGLGREYCEYQEASFEPAFGYQPLADHIHTPPHTVTAAEAVDAFPATEDATPQKAGFSNPDIIDEQPPTPTSIKSRKRSAHDAFDEDTDVAIEHDVMESDVKVAAPEVADSTAEQVTPQPQRPIAQPKSIFRRALSAAKVMVPATALGAVFTVGALTALPESFFTVA